MIGLLKFGKRLDQENKLVSLPKEFWKDSISIKNNKIRIKEIKINLVLKYLLIKVYQLSLEDQIFPLMDNYFYCLQVNGKEIINHPPNIVLFFIVKISLINQQSWSQLMENLHLFANFAPFYLKNQKQMLAYLNKIIIWYLP